MCGIAGFAGRPDRGVLSRLVETLRHRGPDDTGFWNDENVSLGMGRLSIVDLETGGQPASDESGDVLALLNGEIYNHVELRKDLEAKGHRFRSRHSDTEVIPHLYEEYGIDFLNRLNGMFAVALWDRKEKTLILARDRCGIKPLFFSSSGGHFVFASEIKAVLEHPAVSRQPNFKALSHYFTFKNVPSPLSAFAGVEQLRPGEVLLFHDGRVSKRLWWKIDFEEDETADEASARSGIRALLEDSVRLQMRSDVPIGAYLSGGIDSSAVVALMSRSGAANLNTFTLAYEDDFSGKSADRDFAARIAGIYGTKHHVCTISSKDVSDAIEGILTSFDEPFSGTISTYFLTKLISRYVKVALSGDGADELFGSYLAHRNASAGGFPPSLEDEVDRRMALYVWTDAEKRRLFTPRMRDLSQSAASRGLVEALYRDCAGQDTLNRALCVDWQTLLPDQVLAFVDRLSMAHSVEVRPPFLDHRLVSFVARLPGRLKIRNGRVKHILKEAVADLLPPEVLDRPKEGFVLPVHQWLTGSLRNYAEDLLAESNLKSHGLLDVPFVGALLKDLRSGTNAQPAKIWNLMMFQAWWNRYFGKGER